MVVGSIPTDDAKTDDAFLTGTGLERDKLLGRSPGSRRWNPLQKQETIKIGGGSPFAASMPKSVLSCGREYQLLRE